MIIKKRETIELSVNEKKAIDDTLLIASGILSEATDPHLRKAADALLGAIYEIYDHLPYDDEEEEDYE